jgi:hypothetical protein
MAVTCSPLLPSNWHLLFLLGVTLSALSFGLPQGITYMFKTDNIQSCLRGGRRRSAALLGQSGYTERLNPSLVK